MKDIYVSYYSLDFINYKLILNYVSYSINITFIGFAKCG